MRKSSALAQNSHGLSRVPNVLAMAVVCLALSAAPSGAFDFLFGFGRRSQEPPVDAKPPQAKPQGTTAGQMKDSKGKPRKKKGDKGAGAKPEAEAKAPSVEEPLPPYDPELLRLAEILGALTYLNELCAGSSVGEWRAKMQALLEAEGKSSARRERLAGSYNRGFRDYERTYHYCTPNAQIAIGRFLAEGSKITHEVVNRYGAS